MSRADITAERALGRGAIDISGLFCAPCLARGHNCYAHGLVDGEPQCIFCQDGEPCRHDRQAKIPAAVAVYKNRKPRAHGLKGLAKSLLASGLSEDDVRGALKNQGFKARDISAMFPKQAPAKPAPTLSEVSSVETQTHKTNGHALATPAAARLCKCGCGNPVPAGKRFQFLSGHIRHKDRKLSQAKPGSPKRLGRPPKVLRRNPVPAAVPRHVFSIQVDAKQLSRFLGRLDIDWKQFVLTLPMELQGAIVNHYLASDLASEEAEAAA